MFSSFFDRRGFAAGAFLRSGCWTGGDGGFAGLEGTGATCQLEGTRMRSGGRSFFRGGGGPAGFALGGTLLIFWL